MKEPLLGKTLSQLREVASKLGLPGYTAMQMAEWLYQKQVTSIDGMTNLSKKARALLQENHDMGLVLPDSASLSGDGTKKYLYPVRNRKFIEAAYIPDGERATLCVSSQVGCRMGCRFCMTAR